MLPHGRKERTPRLWLALPFGGRNERQPRLWLPVPPDGRKERSPRLRLANATVDTLREPSPLQHCFHMDSASSASLRISRSILHSTPVTKSLFLIFRMRWKSFDLRLLASDFCRAASLKYSTAKFALRHRRVAARMSLQTSWNMTPAMNFSLQVSFMRAW